MKVCLLAVLMLALAAPAAMADRRKLIISADTEEGQLLQEISQETDAGRRIRLMEQFVSKYPKHEGVGWVYSQMQAAYRASGDFDKAMAAGQKVLGLDPDNLDVVYQNLKAAEAKNDPEGVLRWALATSAVARKLIQSGAPQDPTELQDWKRQVDYAKQVDTYTDYALYVAALRPPGPATAGLFEALEQRNPSSPYLAKLYPNYLIALRQTNPAKLAAAAERLQARDPNSEDVLLVLADTALGKREADKAINYAARVIEITKSRPRPEGVSENDWETKRKATLGRAHWISGMAAVSQNKFAQADQALRAALPLIQFDQSLVAGALFSLGVSNYRLGLSTKNHAQMNEALTFSKQAAGMPGQYQAQAEKNVKAIEAELARK